ncbi:ATP-binding cassette domain-containing protein [Kineosporia mesophila]|uniref:ATP-binding cassette domain-containing protein n=1 Tax=Kineosporia mesophila TaxID=566012 RepID=A0ABP7AJE9_9ACTN|nr:ABC transporter ATP-binding protein [Kineosporia mesophila]MCD5352455.1 ABC transporter ATP-binding protein [Kineosporia mesophila]
MSAPLLKVDGLRVEYGRTVAVNDVSFEVAPGEIVGLVGESGSGKTTIGRAVAGFLTPGAGSIDLAGDRLGATRSLAQRRGVQMVFQDPYLSLNPRLSTWSMLRELVTVHRLAPKAQVDDFVRTVLGEVALTEELARVRPSRLSGGQRQRAAIARAVVLRPQLIVADEPTSALDVSVQASILRLFASLRTELGVGFLVISHDLSLVRFLCDSVLVMQDGEIVERGPVAEVLTAPQHPYTQRLLKAVPRLPSYAKTSGNNREKP